MTKYQIEYLKLLGYEDTVEDGAVLQHKRFHDIGCFIWKDETFKDVLSMYPERLAYAVKQEAARNVLRR